MSDEDNIIEIEELYVNFYTQQGIVKALDGINLKIRRGETFGLVGETGCGKSVTANSVLRLIPMPPGKIEQGRIYFQRPTGSDLERSDIDQRVNKSKQSGAKDASPEMEELNRELAQWSLRSELHKKLNDLRLKGGTSGNPEFEAAYKELADLDSKYDLLARTPEYMQRIRGKYISMIFQEPMSALNPVFTVGNQISEIILLHESKEMCESVVKKLEEREDTLKKSRKAKLVRTEKNEFKCSNCNATIAEKTAFCPNCNYHFRSAPFQTFTLLRIRTLHKIYTRMVKDPNTFGLRITAKIPVVRRYRKMLLAEATDRAERMIRLVRIPDPDKVVNSYPFELSGGMQQRVMIAMALACSPRMLIADEPTTALDVTIQAQILKLMQELQEETGTSILLITHNLGVVAEVCDRVGVMYAGTVAEVGEKMDVFKEPLHPYTQGLMNSIPNVAVDTARLLTIEGNVPNLLRPPTGCRFHTRCPFAMDVCTERKPPMSEPRKGHFVACHLYPEGN